MSQLVSRRARAVGGLAAISGVVLLVWSIRLAGAGAVLEGVRHVGAGFGIVLLFGGLRHVLRTVAWRLCLESERPSLGSMWSAYLAGDALGNVTPFGFLISEPSKVVLVRGRVSAAASIAALTIENLFYSASVTVVLVAGTTALLLSFDVPDAVRTASLAMLGATLLVAAIVAFVLLRRHRLFSALIRRLIRLHVAPQYLRARLPHVSEIEDRIFGFVGRHPARLPPILIVEIAYHVAAVGEIWFVVGLIAGSRPPVLTAFVLEYVNRTITIVFQIVPMWIGVDEAGTGLATSLLAFGPATGVSLALVRKARVVVWTAIGLALLAREGLSINPYGNRMLDRVR